jgi:biopolymer transport protein ExbD
MSGGKSHAKSDINVTPLIDIVLVLLIVFIVMVPGLSKALPVVVPQVVKTNEPPKPDPKNPPVVLEIEPKNQQEYKISLQGEEIQLADISDKLAPVVQLQPAGMRKIFLKVDEEVVYQVAVNVLDQVRRASERAKLETAKKPEFGGMDGGDVKVTISLKKKPGAA